MRSWNNFLKKIEEYELNEGIKDLLNTINMVNKDSSETLYKGYYWNNFTNKKKSVELKYNPLKEVIETIQTNIWANNTEEIVSTYYKIGFHDDMYVEKESIINHYSKVDGGYQLLLETIESIERYTKSGFQKSKKNKVTYCPYFIFRTDEDREYCNIVSPKELPYFKNSGFISGLNVQEYNTECFLSSLNYSIKSAPNETNDFVVFFKNNNNQTLCFPAFFAPNRTIISKPFINDPSLQFSADYPSGYKDNDVNFEGRTTTDAEKFIKNRHNLVSNINAYEEKTLLKKTLTSVNKF